MTAPCGHWMCRKGGWKWLYWSCLLPPFLSSASGCLQEQLQGGRCHAVPPSHDQQHWFRMSLMTGQVSPHGLFLHIFFTSHKQTCSCSPSPHIQGTYRAIMYTGLPYFSYLIAPAHCNNNNTFEQCIGQGDPGSNLPTAMEGCCVPLGQLHLSLSLTYFTGFLWAQHIGEKVVSHIESPLGQKVGYKWSKYYHLFLTGWFYNEKIERLPQTVIRILPHNAG